MLRPSAGEAPLLMEMPASALKTLVTGAEGSEMVSDRKLLVSMPKPEYR